MDARKVSFALVLRSNKAKYQSHLDGGERKM